MKRTLVSSLLISASFALTVVPAMAKTVQVGTCMPPLQSYPTISQAVSTVPSGSTVLVCPGTYPEQVTITQPLTLRGVQAGNAANPTITVPTGGLTKSAEGIFYQVLVQGTGSSEVNISNISINGNNNGVPKGFAIAGVFYLNSAGKLRRTAIFNQTGNGGGGGVIFINGDPSPIALTISGNSIHDFDAGGISVAGNLTATISANEILAASSFTGSGAPSGIALQAAGTVVGNRVITHPQPPGISAGIGIFVRSNVSITNNTVEAFTVGIWLLANSNQALSNTVVDTGEGITISGSGNDVEHNRVTHTVEGIDFNCMGTGNTVIHNVVNDSFFGIFEPHGTNTMTPNVYSNVTRLVSPTC